MPDPNDDIFDVFEAAYALPENPEAFERFIDAIKTYLFGDVDGASVIAAQNSIQREAPVIERHTERIQSLISRVAQSSEAADTRFHAIIEISARTRSVTGNLAAERLLNCSFPIDLQDLPFDHEAMRFMSGFLLAGPSLSNTDRVFLASIDGAELRTCMALIQQPENAEGHARVSISYIDWTENLLSRIASAFGLTERELFVLKGFLRYKSQREIAALAGRSLETIKSQSKSILRKTGCQKMSDVMLLAASIAYLLRQLPEAAPSKTDLPWRTPEQSLQKFQSQSGRSIAWYRVGEGTRPVLFVHGLIQGPFFTPDFVRLLSNNDLYLVCPSRPGFGLSDPSTSRDTYNSTVVSDVDELLDQLEITACPVLVHQGGSSHGFRIANALGPRCISLIMIDGGVPVHDKASLAYMDSNSRMMAAASRRSPAFLKMLTRLGLSTYKLRGIDAFLKELYKASEADKRALNRPEVLRVLSEGIFHITEQDSEVWIRDGNAAMQNWEQAFSDYGGKQSWLLGDDARILSHEWIEKYLRNSGVEQIKLIKGAGNTLLHTHSDQVIEAVTDCLDASFVTENKLLS